MRFTNPCNNEAEYEAVLHDMRMAKACGATRMKINGKSNLIAQQVMKECEATCANMISYRAMYHKLEGNFEGCEVTHIGRESNEEADSRANVRSKCLPIPPGVFIEEIFERSVKIKPAISEPALATRPGAEETTDSVVVEIHTELNKGASIKHIAQVLLLEPLWTEPYAAYLLHGELPEELVHRQQIICRCKSFTVIKGKLNKRSMLGVLQRCITREDDIAIL
jgi:hypothetical protein